MKKKSILFTVVIAICIFMLIPITANAKCNNMKQKETYDKLFEELEWIDDEYLEEWFISYTELADEYSVERETIDCIFSDEEIYYILRAIETETHGASFIQKVNVANVILNRYSDYETFGYVDMVDVITHENQFAYGRTNITDETRHALDFAFEIKDTTYGSIGFRSDKKVDKWNNWVYVFYDGAHWFYGLEERG